MSNVADILRKGNEILKKNNVSDSNYTSREILKEVLKISTADIFTYPNREVSYDCEKVFWDMVKKRIKGMPLQYIFNSCEFMGLKFYVDENVLIPRADTEILVETIISTLVPLNKTGLVLDLCTGSGCIPISLSKNGFKKCIGLDISKNALNIAEKNSKINNALNIDLIQGDVLAIKDISRLGEIDAVCSNPPYIRTAEVKELMKDVRDFEPHIALDGGEDGLIFYRAIARLVRDSLKNGVYLFFEIGFDQALEVTNILRDNSFKNIAVIKDLNSLDRVIYGVLEVENA